MNVTRANRHRERWRLSAVLAAVLALAGCQTGTADSPAPGTTGPADTGAPTSAPTGGAPDLSGEGQVVVYDGGGAWGNAQRQAFFDAFERDTGIKVVANPGTPASRILAGIEAGAPGYDVIDVSGGRLGAWGRDGHLLPIDYSYWDEADKAGFDIVATQEYGVPALFYAMQIVYSTEAFPDGGPQTWADLWKADSFPGPRSLGTGSFGPGAALFEVALLADGVSPADLYPLDFDRAFQSLDRIRPSITKFWESGAEGPQLVADGEVVAGNAWNGRIYDRKSQGGAIDFSWEQAILQWDAWAVPKGAQNVENAMKFIAYASKARPMARFAELITYAPPNSLAFELIGSERAALLPTAPELREQVIPQDYDWWNSESESGETNDQLAPKLWEQWIAGG